MTRARSVIHACVKPCAKTAVCDHRQAWRVMAFLASRVVAWLGGMAVAAAFSLDTPALARRRGNLTPFPGAVPRPCPTSPDTVATYLLGHLCALNGALSDKRPLLGWFRPRCHGRPTTRRKHNEYEYASEFGPRDRHFKAATEKESAGQKPERWLAVPTPQSLLVTVATIIGFSQAQLGAKYSTTKGSLGEHKNPSQVRQPTDAPVPWDRRRRLTNGPLCDAPLVPTCRTQIWGTANALPYHSVITPVLRRISHRIARLPRRPGTTMCDMVTTTPDASRSSPPNAWRRRMTTAAKTWWVKHIFDLGQEPGLPNYSHWRKRVVDAGHNRLGAKVLQNSRDIYHRLAQLSGNHVTSSLSLCKLLPTETAHLFHCAKTEGEDLGSAKDNGPIVLWDKTSVTEVLSGGVEAAEPQLGMSSYAEDRVLGAEATAGLAGVEGPRIDVWSAEGVVHGVHGCDPSLDPNRNRVRYSRHAALGLLMRASGDKKATQLAKATCMARRQGWRWRAYRRLL
ncbi:hypothetical protein Purlil1_8487 [Purpureocillium lilacinum]|uniref:Uncharacterized protein n=1 Tax=Purpureocillium lilacinum TaxID=33203 RepID=A0ABR0BSZ7_PURLI|nr:hypothetical protein Purlil1_8487 [Purpureocillium lilacinum]